MNRPGALLSVAALFLSGVAIGALGIHLYYAQQLREPGGPPERAWRMFAGRFEERLDLSPEQAAEIEAILEESRAESEELRREIQPRVRAVMDETAERIDAVLTPVQREEFRRMREEHRRRAEQFLLGPRHGRRGPGRGPPHGRPPPGGAP